MSRLPKQQLAGKLASKTEKIKFQEFAQKNPKPGCRKLADIYKIGKTATANTLKTEKKFVNSMKRFMKNQRNVTSIASTTR